MPAPPPPWSVPSGRPIRAAAEAAPRDRGRDARPDAPWTAAARETKSFALSMIMTSVMINPSIRVRILLGFIAPPTGWLLRNILPT